VLGKTDTNFQVAPSPTGVWGHYKKQSPVFHSICDNYHNDTGCKVQTRKIAINPSTLYVLKFSPTTYKLLCLKG